MKIINRPAYLDRLIRFKDKQIIKVITGVRRSGKSTLLKILSGINKNYEGDIFINKIPIFKKFHFKNRKKPIFDYSFNF